MEDLSHRKPVEARDQLPSYILRQMWLLGKQRTGSSQEKYVRASIEKARECFAGAVFRVVGNS